MKWFMMISTCLWHFPNIYGNLDSNATLCDSVPPVTHSSRPLRLLGNFGTFVELPIRISISPFIPKVGDFLVTIVK